MSDPETDRVQYLLQRRVDCELTEAEQHELALYDDGSVERALVCSRTKAEPSRSLDVAKASALAAIGAIGALVFGFIDPFAGVLYCGLLAVLWPERKGEDAKLSFSFRIVRRPNESDVDSRRV